MTAPGDFPFRPKARTPAFYGSYDWHSCVEMHWLLLRLLRVAEDVVPAKEIKSALNAHFRPMALAAEVEFVSGKDGLKCAFSADLISLAGTTSSATRSQIG